MDPGLFKTIVILAAFAVIIDTGECRRLRDFLETWVGKEEFGDGLPVDQPFHWALLVAGSNGYENYRHQADVCHAYQLLKQNGLDDDHIIVMVYDDIADHVDNPFPGQIFNEPGGNDVYVGCAKDYTGDNVTAENFLAVLRGDKAAMAGIGSGRVIEPSENSKVFLYYNDHGGTGVVGMPSGPNLYAVDLVHTLTDMSVDKKFGEMVVYVEACESGSMFDGLLPEGLGVYAVTAANSIESSYAAFCPEFGGYFGKDDASVAEPNPTAIGTCMGDLFSASFMEDTKNSDLGLKSLKEQYEIVKYATSRRGTYWDGSHVMRYGDIDMDREVIGGFLSVLNVEGSVESQTEEVGKEAGEKLVEILESKMLVANRVIDQREADLVYLTGKAINALKSNEVGDQSEAVRKLNKVLDERKLTDERIKSVVKMLVEKLGHLVGDVSVMQLVMQFEDLIESIIHEKMSRKDGDPAVDDWQCLKGMITGWEEACGKVPNYILKYSRTFANLCNLGVPLDHFRNVVSMTCSDGHISHLDFKFPIELKKLEEIAAGS